ncbi:Immunoglobulin A1 protease [Dissostichus eleginoides]|uniref:Immunoglobulin A1 protease n=1 Tax=Dissostichus eleginoides TaxID=100907 RepID=A0AAD9CB67_DISEL|nr:Immunoglobulin A1 protease [Dissostichus eleginoides]
MSRERLPLIGSSGSRTTAAKPPLSSPALPRPHQANHRKRSQQQTSSSSSHPHPGPSSILVSDTTMTPWGVPQDSATGGGVRGLRARRRLLPQRRLPRPPRLAPLRPVTNLSFSRSFTFSFFELPLHQLPRCRAERIRNLMLLLKQIHY